MEYFLEVLSQLVSIALLLARPHATNRSDIPETQLAKMEAKMDLFCATFRLSNSSPHVGVFLSPFVRLCSRACSGYRVISSRALFNFMDHAEPNSWVDFVFFPKVALFLFTALITLVACGQRTATGPVAPPIPTDPLPMLAVATFTSTPPSPKLRPTETLFSLTSTPSVATPSSLPITSPALWVEIPATIRYVQSEVANLRSEPSTEGQAETVVGQAYLGSSLELCGHSLARDWYRLCKSETWI